MLRLGRLVGVLSKSGQLGQRLLVRHKLHYVILITGVAVVGAAALVLVVEGDGGGSIDSFGDALWWAVTTVTTVGYGDAVPVTPAGRGIAAALMVAGIALFGVLTANIATFFIEEEQAADPMAEQLAEVLRRLDRMEKQLAADRPVSIGPAGESDGGRLEGSMPTPLATDSENPSP